MLQCREREYDGREREDLDAAAVESCKSSNDDIKLDPV